MPVFHSNERNSWAHAASRITAVVVVGTRAIGFRGDDRPQHAEAKPDADVAAAAMPVPMASATTDLHDIGAIHAARDDRGGSEPARRGRLHRSHSGGQYKGTGR